MNKIWSVVIVVGLVIAAYLLLMVIYPVLVDVVSTTNVTMTEATANFTGVFPGTSEFLLSTPWILFFVLGVIGIIVIVVILRQP